VAAPLLLGASERWGRKPVLVATGLLTAEALFVAAWASDVYMLFVSRVALGIAVADVAVVVAAGADLVRRHGAAPEPLALGARGYALGLLGGPVLALALSPYGYGVPAYVAAVLAVVALIEVVALFEETRPAQAGGRALS
jgi:DHA1 family tetracycline resistance protein-like MFS transporter